MKHWFKTNHPVGAIIDFEATRKDSGTRANWKDLIERAHSETGTPGKTKRTRSSLTEPDSKREKAARVYEQEESDESDSKGSMDVTQSDVGNAESTEERDGMFI
jgi:hypothetical protein